MEFLTKLYRISLFGCLLGALLMAACTVTPKKDAEIERFASITGVKKDKLAYYKQLHANAWPAVLKQIRASNIQNYSIYLKEIEGNYYLFSYFEYTGDNFEADMNKMAQNKETQQWWKETDPCQIPLPDAAAKGAIWADMEEVFHTD